MMFTCPSPPQHREPERRRRWPPPPPPTGDRARSRHPWTPTPAEDVPAGARLAGREPKALRPGAALSPDRSPAPAAPSADGGADGDTIGSAADGGPPADPGSVAPTSPTAGSSESPPEPLMAASARPNCQITSDGALPGTVTCVEIRRPAPTIPLGSCSGAM